MAEPLLYGASATQLTNASARCEETAQFIEGLRQRVAGVNTELTTSGWKGNASLRFKKALDDWDVEFKAVIAILEQMYDKLNVGARKYAEAAQENENMNLLGEGTTAGYNAADSHVNGRVDYPNGIDSRINR